MALDDLLLNRPSSEIDPNFPLLTNNSLIATYFQEFTFSYSGCEQYEGLLYDVLAPGTKHSGKALLIYVGGEFVGPMKLKGEKTILSCVDRNENLGSLRKGGIYEFPDLFTRRLLESYTQEKDYFFSNINIEEGAILNYLRQVNEPRRDAAFRELDYMELDLREIDQLVFMARDHADSRSQEYDLVIPNMIDFASSQDY